VYLIDVPCLFGVLGLVFTSDAAVQRHLHGNFSAHVNCSYQVKNRVHDALTIAFFLAGCDGDSFGSSGCIGVFTTP
jgi:hypothetical protein